MAPPAKSAARRGRISELVVNPWQAFWRYILPVRRYRPGVVVLATSDGMLHIGRFAEAPRGGAAGALEIILSVASVGHGNPDYEPPAVRLSPDETQFVAREIETLRDATDMRITLFDVASGLSRLTATDNARPDVIFRGDDPLSPVEVLEEQRRSDVYWEEDRLIDPKRSRPIVEGRFAEEYGGASIGDAGWTNTGELVVVGSCPVAVGPSSSGVPYPWWGLVGPAPGNRWAFLSKAVGAVPASVVIRSTPTLARVLTRGAPVGDGFQLLINGIAQSAPALATGVVSFDGPFTR